MYGCHKLCAMSCSSSSHACTSVSEPWQTGVCCLACTHSSDVCTACKRQPHSLDSQCTLLHSNSDSIVSRPSEHIAQSRQIFTSSGNSASLQHARSSCQCQKHSQTEMASSSIQYEENVTMDVWYTAQDKGTHGAGETKIHVEHHTAMPIGRLQCGIRWQKRQWVDDFCVRIVTCPLYMLQQFPSSST